METRVCDCRCRSVTEGEVNTVSGRRKALHGRLLCELSWCTLVIQHLGGGGMRIGSKVILSHIVSSRPAWTAWDTVKKIHSHYIFQNIMKGNWNFPNKIEGKHNFWLEKLGNNKQEGMPFANQWYWVLLSMIYVESPLCPFCLHLSPALTPIGLPEGHSWRYRSADSSLLLLSVNLPWSLSPTASSFIKKALSSLQALMPRFLPDPSLPTMWRALQNDRTEFLKWWLSLTVNQKGQNWGWGHYLVGECLHSVHQVLNPIYSTKNDKEWVGEMAR